jgi:pseudoazurin
MSLRFAGVALLGVVMGIGMGAASAAEHVVKMVNDNGKGDVMAFEPSFIAAAPGDTVKFVVVDPGHNAETMPEIWPEGAKPFRGDFSKDVVLTVETEGVYGVKCLPHYGMGMMALIVAGKPVNEDQVKAFKPPAPAAKRFEAIAANLK